MRRTGRFKVLNSLPKIVVFSNLTGLAYAKNQQFHCYLGRLDLCVSISLEVLGGIMNFFLRMSNLCNFLFRFREEVVIYSIRNRCL